MRPKLPGLASIRSTELGSCGTLSIAPGHLSNASLAPKAKAEERGLSSELADSPRRIRWLSGAHAAI
jgi:hypothetical protein